MLKYYNIEIEGRNALAIWKKANIVGNMPMGQLLLEHNSKYVIQQEI